MKIIQKLAVATAASGLLTASALAADLYVPVESPYIPEVSSLSWTGAYVGVHAGYGWGESREDDPTDDDWNYDIDGWLAGVQAGYNVNLDGVVLGLEGDIAWSGIGFDDTADDDYAADINWISTFRGRVGFAADAFLIYGTAGVAFAGVGLRDVDYSDDTISEVHTGWVVGAGVETMVTDSISLKAEYLYHQFATENYVWEAEDYDEHFQFDVSTVKVGLNFHF